jgi:hypothetical protein
MKFPIRKAVLNVSFMGGIALTAVHAGLGADRWEYWVLTVCGLGLILNSMLD